MPENVRRASFKIVIRRVEAPFSSDPMAELNWICESLGFFEATDRLSGEGKEKPVAVVFKEILRLADSDKAPSSTYLAKSLNISRGSVIHHLNTLQRSGLIVRQGRFYYPRSRSIARTISEIEEDIERVFARMKKTALEIDRELGIGVEQTTDAKE